MWRINFFFAAIFFSLLPSLIHQIPSRLVLQANNAGRNDA